MLTEPQFSSLEGITSLSKHHHDGGDMAPGLQLLCERNRRTALIPATLIAHHIGSVKMDITGYGKYAESTCQVQIGDKIELWPFSMLYVKTIN